MTYKKNGAIKIVIIIIFKLIITTLSIIIINDNNNDGSSSRINLGNKTFFKKVLSFFFCENFFIING